LGDGPLGTVAEADPARREKESAARRLSGAGGTGGKPNAVMREIPSVVAVRTTMPYGG